MSAVQESPATEAMLALLRPDLRGFAGYASARRDTAQGSVWLNANESPWPSGADPGLGLNRYPEPQPAGLRAALAKLYAVDAGQVLVTRGSDEGIDLLVRAFCRPGRDAVAIAPPCFGMYAVCARVQAAPLVEVPLIDDGQGWTLDEAALLAATRSRGARLVFLCSPANPTGQALSMEAISRLAAELAGQAVLVLDEAYGEYSREPSAATLLDAHANLVVLRTLSKAHALAGARIGTLLADAALVALLRNLAPPYPVPLPCALLAQAALQDDALAQSRQRCAQVIEQRALLAERLRSLPGVRRVYPSQGNFLLLRLDDAQGVLERLLQAGIVVRDMRAHAGLGDALRISLGTPADNAAVLAALAPAVAA